MRDLNPHQQKVLKSIVRIGRKRGATRKEIKAAVETGLVESNLTNVNYGDADSLGWRQERASLYKNPLNLKASINRFYDETGAVRDQYGTAGALAAAVQRPAAQYRGRYGERAREASQLMRSVGGGRQAAAAGGVRGNGPGTPDRVRLGQQTTFDEAGYEQARRASIVGGLIAKRRGTDSILFKSGLLSTQAPSPADFTKTGLTSQLVRGTRSTGGTGIKGSTLVIGDSLGVGTLPYLERILDGKVVADVVGGRSSADGIRALRQKTRSQDFANIVLDVGTNDLTAKQMAQSIRAARRLAPNAQIYIPTVNGPYATSRKNAVLQRIAANNSNVTLVPWNSQSRGQLVDGIHASSQGYQARARLIAETMGAQPAPARQKAAGGAIKPRGTLREMFYNGPGGINVDEGRRVGRGFVPGHESHVHYGGDPTTVVQIGRMAQRMGLNVGENPRFGRVTQGAHVSNSLHYSGQAIDVTGDRRKLLAFNRKVARLYGV